MKSGSMCPPTFSSPNVFFFWLVYLRVCHFCLSFQNQLLVSLLFFLFFFCVLQFKWFLKFTSLFFCYINLLLILSNAFFISDIVLFSLMISPWFFFTVFHIAPEIYLSSFVIFKTSSNYLKFLIFYFQYLHHLGSCFYLSIFLLLNDYLYFLYLSFKLLFKGIYNL